MASALQCNNAPASGAVKLTYRSGRAFERSVAVRKVIPHVLRADTFPEPPSAPGALFGMEAEIPGAGAFTDPVPATIS